MIMRCIVLIEVYAILVEFPTKLLQSGSKTSWFYVVGYEFSDLVVEAPDNSSE